jgi:hypothetical protein
VGRGCRRRVPLAAVLVVKAIVFGLAAVALAATGRAGLAIAFAVVVVLNTALATVDRDAIRRGAGTPAR